jgi:polysaccharide pyruvyl transferase WcaK-like protein
LTGLCGLFVSIRMHSALLAMGCGVPTVCIAYADKVRDFADALGEIESVVDINALASADGAAILNSRLMAALEQRSAVTADLSTRWRNYAAGCQVYDEAAASLLSKAARANVAGQWRKRGP